MAAAMAAIHARRGTMPAVSSAKRREAYEEQERFWKDLHEQAHFNKLNTMLREFDADGSGTLDAQELKKLIEHYGEGAIVRGKKVPSNPTDEEISWILKAAGKHKLNSVDLTEMQMALDLWHTYVSNRAHIEAVFDKYDVNKSKMLERDQLKAYLTDLNDGHPPSDGEVLTIMKEVEGPAAEGISKVQLMLVTSAWYTHVEEVQTQCCVVC